MILFVFEGEKREKVIFNTIKQIFFKKTQTFVYCYCCNIYSLYQEMKTLDVFGDAADILHFLKKEIIVFYITIIQQIFLKSIFFLTMML